jgi:hypothetical protein
MIVLPSRMQLSVQKAQQFDFKKVIAENRGITIIKKLIG